MLNQFRVVLERGQDALYRGGVKIGKDTIVTARHEEGPGEETPVGRGSGAPSSEFGAGP